MAKRALPIEVDAASMSPGSTPPLGMPPAQFLRDYWQKRPLLIRNAFPGFVSPISPEDLAGLACEDTALSRIVAHELNQETNDGIKQRIEKNYLAAKTLVLVQP